MKNTGKDNTEQINAGKRIANSIFLINTKKNLQITQNRGGAA